MYGKIVIKCKLTLLTGLHIGGSSAFSAIGAVDSPVVRDSLTGEPMLPGSSLKGKMRSLLAKAMKNHYLTQECADDPDTLKRLFGSAGDQRRQENPKPARLQFADAFLINADVLKKRSGLTEVKFENNISRLTGVANPRQIERVVRGAEFAVNMVYDLEEAGEIKADFDNIARALKLVSMDYLGGHGSRGYGKVAFSDFELQVKDGECPEDVNLLLTMLKEVEAYGLLAVQA
ncbi:type III-A CRISPR-associated RAMP protein Csm3 [Syntrophomonas palmitatica]|uniref:type III-A CRISPR-associated RAMP protein Csm3 n=1 Tax=Syntrophomonas palmitatica TaxID=402877 RepID=UPI0006D2B11C|nr:type III-A CRISPR-associated RAMP protein Csm3 [Syntrophomonas palmitatica]